MEDKDRVYAMGRSDHETRRLIRQSQLYAPFTRQLFGDAGIGRGMRVLDLGSGAGDVALLAAALVGPTGSVVGIDTDATILETARTRARIMGYDNVTFVAGDARALPNEQVFDAIVSRFFLVFQSDPAETLCHVARRLRPGGIVVSQEHDWVSPPASDPPSALWRQLWRWTHAVGDCLGMDLAITYHLHHIYREAGLSAPHLRFDAPIGSEAAWGGYTYAADFLHSLLPLFAQYGIATAEEVASDTFAARLYAETGAQGGVLRATPAIGGWGYKL